MQIWSSVTPVTPRLYTFGRRFDPREILKTAETPGEGLEGELSNKSVMLKSKMREIVLMAIEVE